MAIYIGMKLTASAGSSRTYSFFSSDGQRYGTLAVDTETKEVCLIDAVDERASEFAYPRAKRAIEKAIASGTLGEELCYAA
jgi:hypothetical protein